MSMPFSPYQECPRCHGLCNVEDVKVYSSPASAVTWIHCAECQFGVDAIWELIAGEWHRRLVQEHDVRKNPVDYGAFVQRLKDVDLIAA